MTTFFLAISLLLNGIAIYFIIILYTRQNRILEIEKTQESIKKDLENEISAFLFEIKEENEEFIKRFQQVKSGSLQQNNASETLKLDFDNEMPVTRSMDHIDQSTTNEWEGIASHAFKKQAVKVYQKAITDQEDHQVSEQELINESEIQMDPLPSEKEEIYRDLLISQVKVLEKQGLSIDEIAKKLNKGKKEIELLLKFS
jgi:hypothetical protein